MMRRIPISVCGAIAVIASFAPAVSAGAAPVSSRSVATTTDCSATPSNFSDQDIDNSGKDDPAVGVQRATVDGRALAGAVDVSYDPIGQDQLDVVRQRLDETSFAGLPAPEAGDRFGAAIAYTDVNGDNCRDVVIGAPGVDQGRGAVVIALGSPSGVATSGAIQVKGVAPGEHFGYSVAAAGNNIWVGVPDRTVAGRARAGAVDQLRTNGSDSVSRFATWTEDSPGIPGMAESGDRFGRVLRALVPDAPEFDWATDSAPETLIVGSPNEWVGNAADAGKVTVLSVDGTTHRVATARMIAQGAGAPGAAEPGDRFGAAVDGWHGTLVVGVPGEDVGNVRDAGIVQTFRGLHTTGVITPKWTINQGVPGVAGRVSRDHQFGAAVAVGQLSWVGCRDMLVPQIMIGAPGTAIDGKAQAGQVVAVPVEAPVAGVDPYCRGGHQALHPRVGGRFGAAIAFANSFDSDGNPLDPTVAIGSPGGGLSVPGSGVVELKHDCQNDGACIAELYYNSSGEVPDQGYGAVLGRSPNG